MLSDNPHWVLWLPSFVTRRRPAACLSQVGGKCSTRFTFYFYYYYFFFFYLFLAALGLCYRAQAFSSCGERRLLFVAVRGLLTAVASLVAEHGLQAHGLQ